tara:strand:+ start:1191 stop:2618 length:1428 start_codon:yes stop_codon:yes gene_type:complete
MATLTGKLISNSYKDLLQVSNSNSGVDSTVRFVSDGEGTNSALKISNSEVETTGKLTVGANLSASGNITANAATLIATVCASTYFGDGSNLTGVEASIPTSVSTFTINQLTVVSGASFTGKVSGTAAEFSGNVSAASYFGDGSNLTNLPTAPSSVSAFTVNQLTVVSGAAFNGKVSGTAAEFSGNVSAANLFASTNVFVGGSAVPTASDIAAVSALTSVNKAAITSINSILGDGSNFATSAELAAVSSALATSIGNSNAAITSINSILGDGSNFATSAELAAVSSALATSIGNSNTNIAAVSALTSVNAAAITSINAVIEGSVSADKGTFNTLVVKTSASVSGELRVGSKIGVDKASPEKQIHISKSAAADVNQLTDATVIAVDFNTGQNFTVTLTDNRTLGNPTNCTPGQVGSIFIVQDGTGNRTLGYSNYYQFAGGTAPDLSTAANAIDRLDYIVHTAVLTQAVLTKAYASTS